jgi:hypothetical protein
MYAMYAMAFSVIPHHIMSCLSSHAIISVALFLSIANKFLLNCKLSYLGYLPLWAINICLQRVSAEIIRKIETLVDLGDIVVTGMTTDPAVLGRFFQKVGASELDFLVRSGTYFGFLLGLIQMFVWMTYPVYWTLPISGAVVGFITNWIAIKMIFEPVTPCYIGPFKIHGMFLRRQKEVSAEFSEYLANNLLTSEELWREMLQGKQKKEFVNIIRAQLPFLTDGMAAAIMRDLEDSLVSNGPTELPALPTWHALPAAPAPVGNSSSGSGGVNGVVSEVVSEVVRDIATLVALEEPVSAVVKAIIEDKRHDEEIDPELGLIRGHMELGGSHPAALVLKPPAKHPLHAYIDDAIALEALLKQRMGLLSPAEFERLLHPIFEEDELTLIGAGGVLGLAAGAIQWWMNVLFDRRAAAAKSSSNGSSGSTSSSSISSSSTGSSGSGSSSTGTSRHMSTTCTAAAGRSSALTEGTFCTRTFLLKLLRRVLSRGR